jgi:uroporphyrinogen-III synthase
VVNVVEAYETVAPEASRTRLQSVLRDPDKKPDLITFTSSSSVRNFVTLLEIQPGDFSVLQGVKLASIGSVTSHTLRESGLPVDIEAREFTVPGLIRAIVAAFS